MNTSNSTVLNPSANFDAAAVCELLENLLNKKPRVTTADLAASAGLSAAKVKKIVEAAYGDRVQFKRGRTGGIVLTAAIAKVDVDLISDEDEYDNDSYGDLSDEEVID